MFKKQKDVGLQNSVMRSRGMGEGYGVVIMNPG